jgi:ribosomal-protein-alanine N-acetyltransferase
LKFADGYPGQFSLEVMDLLAGERRDEAAGFAPWFMLLKATGEIIGEISGSRPDGGRTYGVGYDVIEPMQRQGYATEALKALLSYLLDQPDVDMVAADTFPDRIASRRVMEKAGMSYARTIRRVEDGEERDVVVYEIKSRRLR